MNNVPDIIYHYCPLRAFEGIVSSKCIWLSIATTTNDFTETKWADAKIQRAIQEARTPENGEVLDELIRKYNDWIKYPKVFLAAFSEKGDLLSQWRAYANDGTGVAIGFNPKYFNLREDVPYPPTNASTKSSVGLCRVIYADSQQMKRIKSAVSRFLKRAPELRLQDYFGALFELHKSVLLFKNAGFQEEVEWRIIHTPKFSTDGDYVTGGVSDLKYRFLDDRIIPYFELGFSESRSEPPIRELVLGPKNRSSESDLKNFLSANGFDGIEIRKSIATYR